MVLWIVKLSQLLSMRLPRLRARRLNCLQSRAQLCGATGAGKHIHYY